LVARASSATEGRCAVIAFEGTTTATDHFEVVITQPTGAVDIDADEIGLLVYNGLTHRGLNLNGVEVREVMPK
jgi:hypothetical protein